MSKRYFVYKLIDDSESKGDNLFQGLVEIEEQTDHQTMNDDDARSLVADTVIRQLIRSKHRPKFSHIEYCELSGPDDPRLHGEADGSTFNWQRCEADSLDLHLGEED